MIKQKSELAEYWETRYSNNQTGWDMGQISPPLKAYIDQLQDKNKRILIPGSGNAYEAEYLISKGFTDVHVVDIAWQPLYNLRDRVGDNPSLHLHQINFFDLNIKFDLIIEQTFFCAIAPSKREVYAYKMAESLNINGKLVGLLFDFPLSGGPPYGGNVDEYLNYFTPYFYVHTFERAYNSHPKRISKEIFINLLKK